MTSQQFSKYMQDPDLVNDQSLGLLEDLVTRYPYCQSGQLLLACNFYATENAQYPNQLKKAAAYAGDRRILKGLIGQAKKTRSLPGEPVHEFRKAISTIPAPDYYKVLPDPHVRTIEPGSLPYERMTQEELLAIVKKRLAEIDAENKQVQINTSDPVPQEQVLPFAAKSSYPHAENRAKKVALIEKFIQEEPRISKPRTAFFNPTESALRSNFDEEEIVSETLAQLYAQQGNLQKAIHIYEKLSLIYQEKSRYFAAQIEKLNS